MRTASRARAHSLPAPGSIDACRRSPLMRLEAGAITRRLIVLAQLLLCLLLITANLPRPANAAVTQTECAIDIAGSRVPVRQWSDSNVKTKAIIVAIHGALRHGGTFSAMAGRLAPLGYVVLSPDLRGHGEWYYTDGAAADKVTDYDKSVDDAVSLLTQLRAEHPQIPIFCLGESVGAAVAVRAATRCPAVNGLILSAMGTRPCVHDVPTIVQHVFEGAKNFDKPLDVTSFLGTYSSDDARVLQEVVHDPLGRTGMSARELLRTNWMLRHTPVYASRLPAHIPVLMLQGSGDEIVKASSARDVLKHLASTEKKMVLFPCGHILLTTQFIRPDVMSSVSDWLVSQTAEQQTALVGAAPGANK